MFLLVRLSDWFSLCVVCMTNVAKYQTVIGNCQGTGRATEDQTLG